MRWGDFIKGGVFSLFLLFLSLTGASLAYQFKPLEPTPVTIPKFSNYGRFPTVLAAQTENKPVLKPVNVLLLGLDSRKGDPSARCDAIHMFSFRPDENKIMITSVPRGTLINETEYISNVCSIYGFGRAQKEIENITEIKADHVIKVGFSQVQGLLRLAGLPPSPTLQALRDRKNYLIGDNQRSYNQAVFFKDSIVRYTDWASKLPWPMQQVGFKMVDTDLTFDQAKEILSDVLISKIYADPNNIEIQIRPKDGYKREDIHVINNIPTDDNWQNDPEFKQYQNDVAGYLTAVTARANSFIDKAAYTAAQYYLTLPMKQKTWLQVENAKQRNQLHYGIVEAFVYSSTDYAKSQTVLEDFILEMSEAKESTLKSKTEEMLKLFQT